MQKLKLDVKNAEVWSQNSCHACYNVKIMLASLGISFTEKIIGENVTKEEFFEKFPGAKTIPQVIINDQLIGGYVEFRKFIDDNIEKPQVV